MNRIWYEVAMVLGFKASRCVSAMMKVTQTAVCPGARMPYL